MKTTIIVLCENTVAAPLPYIGEHGLSFLIESEDTTLFDTGQGLGIMNNMEMYGKNPASIGRVVLSHGHFDHTGGLMAILQAAGKKLPVYTHPEAFAAKTAAIPTPNGMFERPIGMSHKKEDYVNAGAEFREVRGFSQITPSISALSDVKHPDGWKIRDARLKVKTGEGLVDDPLNDDLSLLVRTESGPVVLLGCAHAGIVEILDQMSEAAGVKEFHAVIGGMHLETEPDEYVKNTIDTLKKYRVQKVGASHCTGFARSAEIAAAFGSSYVTASVGAAFSF
jgi:7,8-dihydropterin-6-yl-methyl-4-(beta-D-ribofuranosyl)aminobenzene 5'-phosphate synthase